eukprot:102657_1
MEPKVEKLIFQLRNPPGIDLFEETITKWEYDYYLIKDDINTEEEIKEIVPLSLYRQIKAIVNGTNENVVDNAETIELNTKIRTLNNKIETLSAENNKIKNMYDILQEKYNSLKDKFNNTYKRKFNRFSNNSLKVQSKETINSSKPFGDKLRTYDEDFSALMTFTQKFLTRNNHPMFVSHSTPIVQFIV